jgi:hypothetical protein
MSWGRIPELLYGTAARNEVDVICAFATDGTRDLIAGRSEAAGPAPGRPQPGPRARAPGRGTARQPRPLSPPSGLEPMPPDDEPAVVKRSDLSADWIERVQRYARERGLLDGGPGAEGPICFSLRPMRRGRTSIGSTASGGHSGPFAPRSQPGPRRAARTSVGPGLAGFLAARPVARRH